MPEDLGEVYQLVYAFIRKGGRLSARGPGALAVAVRLPLARWPPHRLPDRRRAEDHHRPRGTVEVSAFDYEISARARADAGVCEPGMVLVPGRLLARSPPGYHASPPSSPMTARRSPWPAAAGHADPGEFAAASARGW